MEASLEMQMLDNFSEPTEQLPENTMEQLPENIIEHLSENRSEQLPENIAAVLPPNYDYIVSGIQQLPNYIIPEGFLINQFKITFFVNVSNIEDSQKWFTEYEETSKPTMPEMKGFQI